MKICCRCKIRKPELDFAKSKSSRDGLQGRCRKCSKIWRENNPEKAKANSRAWAHENPERMAILKRRWEYGIEEEEFQKILSKQDNRCAICLKPFFSNKSRHIDHDHIAEKVRGILCQKCNHGLGLFDDSQPRLHAAAYYLEKYSVDKIVK